MAIGKSPFSYVLLALSLFLLLPAPASAQWRIVIGPPPDPNSRDWTENGVLLPRGYASGYGYYDDYIKWAHPIVLPRPQPPMLLHDPSFSAAGELGIPPAAALFRVRVPADADVWFSGEKTAQRGDARLFFTQPMAEGQAFNYEVRARWLQDGKQIERVRKVVVHSGDRLTLDFQRPEAGEKDAEALPPPRPVGNR